VSKSLIAALVAALGLPLALSAQDRPISVTMEIGPAWQIYNDVEVPNDGSASRFSLSELVGSGPWAAGRLQLDWRVGQRHTLRLLAAPFSLEERASPTSELAFAGEDFVAEVPLRARYKFNSFRVSYRYQVHDARRTRGWIGATAKVRDAVIRIEQDGVVGRKDDVGFVPLLHLAGEWAPGEGWTLRGEADALAGGPGRAVDATLNLSRSLGSGWRLGTGYRMVEGGADVPDVYAFAWLHYGVVSVTWHP
jgi:hypothetical protein